MANDCLVTKLKGSVQNDNLSYFGKLKIQVNNSTGSGVSFQILNNGIISTADGSNKLKITGSSGDYKNSITINNSAWIEFAVGEYLVIMDKYNFRGIAHGNTPDKASVIGFNVEEFEYSPNIESLSGLNNTTSFGNFDVLQGKLPNLSSLSINGTDITATTGVLGTFGFNKTELSFTKITGDLEDFVRARRAKGVSEYTTTVHWHACPGVKFNGNAINTAQGAEFSWTASTITLDGVTVNA